MAKKEPTKPLFDLKHDFYASLDHALQMAIQLIQAVDQAIDLGAISSAPVAEILAERSKAMRAALMNE